MSLLELSVLVAEQQGHVTGFPLYWNRRGSGSRAVEEMVEVSACAVLFSLLSQSLAHVPLYQFP